MLYKERVALRTEWNLLFSIKSSKPLRERREIIRRMRAIERALSNSGDIKLVADQYIYDIHVSVFEGTSCYHGPTEYGTAIGEGCYRRGNGHHH